MECLYYFSATISNISCNERIWIRLISSHNQKHFHKIITLNVLKFLWGVIFPYKGLISQWSIGRKVSTSKVKRFHAQKFLELTPQPFPTQSYVGKGNDPFTRQTMITMKLFKKITHFESLLEIVVLIYISFLKQYPRVNKTHTIASNWSMTILWHLNNYMPCVFYSYSHKNYDYCRLDLYRNVDMCNVPK